MVYFIPLGLLGSLLPNITVANVTHMDAILVPLTDLLGATVSFLYKNSFYTSYQLQNSSLNYRSLKFQILIFQSLLYLVSEQ